MYQVISRKIRRAFNTPEFASARHHFDRKFYRNIHVDVASAGVDEFEHYINFGWREGRDPSPYFTTLLYKDRFMQNHKADTNPYLHFVSLNAANNP